MISWLSGVKINAWNSGQKMGFVIACSGVGYEVQLLPRQISSLKHNHELSLWIHQIQRDDGSCLYGFKEIIERNLFRKLISINGIGPQIGISLLNDYSVQELVEAISTEDVRKLIKSQGVGKRVAERLTVELRNQLREFQTTEITIISKDSEEPDFIDDYKSTASELQQTLEGIGYEQKEINNVLKSVFNDMKTNKKNDQNEIETSAFEDLLRASLVRLSQNNPIQGA